MDFSEEQLESLSRKIEERENRARRIAWLVTVIPIILAGLLLAYTIWQISIKQDELNQKTNQLVGVNITKDALNTEVDVLNTKVPEAEATLVVLEATEAKLQTDLSHRQAELSTAQVVLATAAIEIGQVQEILNAGQPFGEDVCSFSEEVIKEYSSSYTPQAQMLLFLFEMQYRGIPWNPDGFSVTDGFDSPNFAIFALQNTPVEPSDNYKKGNLPWKILPAISWPENGDIVYYKSGYTMFYFELPISYRNPKTRPCVIGMTPLGILSQKMEFAEWTGFLKVPYQDQQ